MLRSPLRSPLIYLFTAGTPSVETKKINENVVAEKAGKLLKKKKNL